MVMILLQRLPFCIYTLQFLLGDKDTRNNKHSGLSPQASTTEKLSQDHPGHRPCQHGSGEVCPTVAVRDLVLSRTVKSRRRGHDVRFRNTLRYQQETSNNYLTPINPHNITIQVLFFDLMTATGTTFYRYFSISQRT